MQNYDEFILRSRRINPAAPFPVEHQAVRIAIYDEYAARAFYAGVVEAFGPQPPFAHIVKAEEQHIQALTALCQRLGIPRPLDPFPQETGIAASWLANCERGVIGEINNIRLYDELLAQVAEPGIRRVFLNLQAASRDNHLPAFQRAVQEAVDIERYHASRGIPPQLAYTRHGPVTDFLEKAFSHAGPIGVFSPLVRLAHPAMLAGIAAGGLGVYWWKHQSGRTSKEI